MFAWRTFAAQGALTATASQEEVVPASEYRALQNQVKELQRLLGKETMEETLEIASGSKKHLLRSLVAEGQFAMTAVCETLGVARSDITERVKRDYVSANPLPDAMTVIAQLPSWFEHYNTVTRIRLWDIDHPASF